MITEQLHHNNGYPGRRIAVAYSHEVCDYDQVDDGSVTLALEQPLKVENLGIVDNNPQVIRNEQLNRF
jgi:hypothetical protein